MAKPSRGRRSPTVSGSSSRSRSRSRPSPSRSLSRSRSLSSSSSSPSRSVSSGSRSPPPPRGKSSARRGRSPPSPQSKGASSPSKKSTPVQESLVLHVGSLSRNVNEGHLKEIFGNYGEVVHVEVAMDRAVNLPKGYAYVEFKARADAEKALLFMDGGQIDGNVVKAKFTLPPRQKVSPPPIPVSSVPKREAPKPDNAAADVEKDGPGRPRERFLQEGDHHCLGEAPHLGDYLFLPLAGGLALLSAVVVIHHPDAGQHHHLEAALHLPLLQEDLDLLLQGAPLEESAAVLFEDGLLLLL